MTSIHRRRFSTPSADWARLRNRPLCVIASTSCWANAAKLYSHVVIDAIRRSDRKTKVYPLPAWTETQDMKWEGRRCYTRIGNNNTIRNASRSTADRHGEATVIGCRTHWPAATSP